MTETQEVRQYALEGWSKKLLTAWEAGQDDKTWVAANGYSTYETRVFGTAAGFSVSHHAKESKAEGWLFCISDGNYLNYVVVEDLPSYLSLLGLLAPIAQVATFADVELFGLAENARGFLEKMAKEQRVGVYA